MTRTLMLGGVAAAAVTLLLALPARACDHPARSAAGGVSRRWYDDQDRGPYRSDHGRYVADSERGYFRDRYAARRPVSNSCARDCRYRGRSGGRDEDEHDYYDRRYSARQDSERPDEDRRDWYDSVRDREDRDSRSSHDLEDRPEYRAPSPRVEVDRRAGEERRDSRDAVDTRPHEHPMGGAPPAGARSPVLRADELWCPVMKQAFPREEAIQVRGQDGRSYLVCCQDCVDKIRSGQFPARATSAAVRRPAR